MAYADYRLCDICEEKVFYDSNLNYQSTSGTYIGTPFKVVGVPKGDYVLDYLGDWAVLCNECSTKYRTLIVPIENQYET